MTTQLVIDVSAFTALGQRFRDAGPIVAREMKTAMARSTAQIEGDAKRVVPVLTGTLRRSITSDPQPLLGRVGTNVPYAKVVEFGIKPGATLGGRVYRKGRLAKPYLIPAFEKNREAALREFALAADRALRALAA